MDDLKFCSHDLKVAQNIQEVLAECDLKNCP